MARNGFRWDTDTLRPQLDAIDAKMKRALTALTEYEARNAETYMKTHAPWTDRTSNARNGLAAAAVNNKHTYSIVLYHSVPYGIWLEVRFSGRNQVIRPAMQVTGQKVMQTATELFARLA